MFPSRAVPCRPPLPPSPFNSSPVALICIEPRTGRRLTSGPCSLIFYFLSRPRVPVFSSLHWPARSPAGRPCHAFNFKSRADLSRTSIQSECHFVVVVGQRASERPLPHMDGDHRRQRPILPGLRAFVDDYISRRALLLLYLFSNGCIFSSARLLQP